MSQSDDMEAINNYMRGQVAKTPASSKIFQDWGSWYNNLSWWDKTMSQDVYDEARSRRNAFNLANAASPAEHANVQQVLATGMTTEEMQGKTRPHVDVTTGKVSKPSGVPAAGSSAIGLHKTIKQGSTGPDVVAWQQILGVTADGKFGPGTKAATIAWQKAHGLQPDGTVGPKTWSVVAGSPVVVPGTPQIISGGPYDTGPTVKPAGKVRQGPAVISPGPPLIATGPVAKVKEQAKVVQANIVPFWQKIPTWLKVFGGLLIAGGAAGAAKAKYDESK